jgi:hypothetical protein
MECALKSLKSTRKMPLPDHPVVDSYGSDYVGVDHSVYLFPAAIRSKEPVKPKVVLEGNESTCFFHADLPATAICDVSGRMICDLCTTYWNGRAVSFESLQLLLKEEGASNHVRSRTNWDSIALSLVILPGLFWPAFLLTAPAALIICITKWRGGTTGILRRSRWRYIVAGLLALLELGLAGLFLGYSFSTQKCTTKDSIKSFPVARP